ncbi:hypothetical protein HMPREF9089_00762 [Eubacterium brachy ATCC 33089]|nr:hypothetical protein HMPREF9089_00762 [Eubacterium brachy ATCC 33089]
MLNKHASTINILYQRNAKKEEFVAITNRTGNGYDDVLILSKQLLFLHQDIYLLIYISLF